LVVSDISSATRNFAAVHRAKRNGSAILLVAQGLRQISARRSYLSRWLATRCERYLCRSADIAVVNSGYTATIVESHRTKQLLTVIASPGLETVPQSEDALRDINTSGPLRLLYVGECSRVKGLYYLIEALSQLSHIDLTLDVVGGCTQEPEYFQALLTQIETHGLADRVKLRGFMERQELNELYKQASVLVVPSLSEGYGMVLAEAICFGLPIVATVAGAISEIVTDNTNAILVPPADSQVLADAIEKLAGNQELRAAMRMANLAKAAEIPTWDDFRETLDSDLLPQLERILPRHQ